MTKTCFLGLESQHLSKLTVGLVFIEFLGVYSGKYDRYRQGFCCDDSVYCVSANLSFLQDEREEVIEAWYMDDSDEDQRLPHHREPKAFVSLDQLAGMHLQYQYTGVIKLTKSLIYI